MQPVPADSGALILGAGLSRRFGSDKRLALLDGSSVAEQTLQKYCAHFAQVRVVVKPEDHLLMRQIQDLPVDVVQCAQARQGMGFSLACGIRGLTWRYAFVGLLDMPFVRTETLTRLQQVACDTALKKIVQPRMADGTAGHPVGWPRHFFPALGALQGDTGARDVLRQHRAEIEYVDIEDRGIIRDIDQPQDLGPPSGERTDSC
ncbi:MAG: NTP transferase domain-containing protein [bacterium]